MEDQICHEYRLIFLTKCYYFLLHLFIFFSPLLPLKNCNGSREECGCSGLWCFPDQRDLGGPCEKTLAETEKGAGKEGEKRIGQVWNTWWSADSNSNTNVCVTAGLSCSGITASAVRPWEPMNRNSYTSTWRDPRCHTRHQVRHRSQKWQQARTITWVNKAQYRWIHTCRYLTPSLSLPMVFIGWSVLFFHLSEMDQLDQKDQVELMDEVPKMLTFQLNGENWTVS